jgi:hypothetical protein
MLPYGTHCEVFTAFNYQAEAVPSFSSSVAAFHSVLRGTGGLRGGLEIKCLCACLCLGEIGQHT